MSFQLLPAFSTSVTWNEEIYPAQLTLKGGYVLFKRVFSVDEMTGKTQIGLKFYAVLGIESNPRLYGTETGVPALQIGISEGAEKLDNLIRFRLQYSASGNSGFISSKPQVMELKKGISYSDVKFDINTIRSFIEVIGHNMV